MALGLGQLSDPTNDEKVFDIVASSVGGKFSEGEMQAINAGMEDFLKDHASNLAKTMASKTDLTFDELLDGKIFDDNDDGSIDADESNKEVWEYIIDQKLNNLNALSEQIKQKEGFKTKLKSLQFEITQAGFSELVGKLTTDPQKNALAKSFLLSYQEVLRNDDETDKEKIKKEIEDAVANSFSYKIGSSDDVFSVNGGVDGLVSAMEDKKNTISSVALDASGKIQKIVFSSDDAPAPTPTPPANPPASNPASVPNAPVDPRANYHDVVGPSATCDNITSFGTDTPSNAGGVPENVVSTEIEKKLPIQNQRVMYRPRNYRGIDRTNEPTRRQARIEDESKSDQRAVLRRITSGKDEDLNIVARKDKIGNKRVDIATNADKVFLNQNFKKPLQQLCINTGLRRGLTDPLDRTTVRDLVVRAYDAGEISKTTGKTKLNEKKYWMDRVSDPNDDISALVSDKGNDYKVFAENMSKLGTLYTQYMRDKYNGTYVAQVVGMFDNHIRMTNGSWTNNDGDRMSLVDIYKENDDRGEISLSGGYTVLDGKRDDKKGLQDLATLSGFPAQEKDLKEIIKIPKDSPRYKKLLNDARDNTNRSAYKKNPLHQSLYDEIRNQLTIPSTLPDARTMTVEGQAYKASPVEVFNIKAIADLAVASNFGGQNDPDVTVDRIQGPTNAPAEGFMHLLADYSLGHGVDFGDVGATTGLQFLTHFRFATSQLQHGALSSNAGTKIQAQEAVLGNVICWLEGVAARNGDSYLFDTIRAYKKKAISDGIPLGQAFIGLMNGTASDNFTSSHPGLVKWMQDTLRDTHLDMQAIMLYGSESTFDTKEKEGEQKSLLTPAEQTKLNTAIDVQYASYKNQIAGLPAGDQEYYNSFVNREMLAQHITNTVYSAIDVGGNSLGIGAGLSLDDVLKGLSLNLSLAVASDGSLVPGLGLSYSHKFENGVGVGVNTNILVPGVSAFVGKQRESQSSRDKLAKSLEAKSVKKIHVGAHASISVIGGSAGVGVGESRDKAEGIADQHQHILKFVRGQMASLLVNPLITEATKAISFEINKASRTGNPNEIISVGAIAAQKKIITSEVRKKFLKIYPGQNEEQYSLMSENFYSILQQYFVNLDQTTKVSDYLKSKIPEMSTFMANQRKEQALAGLHGTRLTGVSVGAHVMQLRGSLSIVTPVAPSFANYNRGYIFKQDPMQYAALKSAEFDARGNRILAPAQSIATVNALLNDVHHDMAFPTDQNNTTPYGSDRILQDPSTGIIQVPVSLYMNTHLNLRIHDSMKGKIAKQNIHGKEYLCFPANTNCRFAALPQNDSVEYVLNIGAAKSEQNDLHIIRGREHLLAGEWMTDYATLGKECNTFTVESVAKMIKTLKESDGGAYSDFDLTVQNISGTQITFNFPGEQAIVIDGAINNLKIVKNPDGKFTIDKTYSLGSNDPKTFCVLFENKKQSTLTLESVQTSMDSIQGASGYPFEEVTALDATTNLITLPPITTGNTVTIDGLSAPNPLQLDYTKKYKIVQTDTNTYTITTMTSDQADFLSYTPLGGSTDPKTVCLLENNDPNLMDCRSNTLNSVRALFGKDVEGGFGGGGPKTKLEKELASLEHKNKASYQRFMDNLIMNNGDNDLTYAELESAYDALKKLMNNAGNTSEIQKIKDFMKTSIDDNGDDHDKKVAMSYLVHKMMCVFAIPSAGYESKQEKSLVSGRKSLFETMRKKTDFPFSHDEYMAGAFKDLSSTDKFDMKGRVSKCNMIGYSAYYRSDKAGSESAKGFGLAPLGEVTIYKESTIHQLSGDQESRGKKWIIEKIMNSEVEKDLIVACYLSKINSILPENKKIDEADLGGIIDRLLGGESVTLENDIILNFTVSAQMYAQGECCNEGLGLSIDNICVTIPGSGGQAKEINYSIDDKTGDLEEIGCVNLCEREMGDRLLNTTSTHSVAHQTKGKDFNVGAAVGKGGYNDGKPYSNPGGNQNPTNLPSSPGTTGSGPGGNSNGNPPPVSTSGG